MATKPPTRINWGISQSTGNIRWFSTQRYCASWIHQHPFHYRYTKVSWNRGTPSHHPFQIVFFADINLPTSYWGTPMTSWNAISPGHPCGETPQTYSNMIVPLPNMKMAAFFGGLKPEWGLLFLGTMSRLKQHHRGCFMVPPFTILSSAAEFCHFGGL